MHDCEDPHCSSYDSCAGRMYDGSGAGAWRAGHADVLRQGHSQSLHGPHRLTHQERIPFLFLQLASILILASFLFGCTSAGNPRSEERGEELVCPSLEARICAAHGTASRIKGDSGSCYCAPRDQVQN